MDKYTLDLIRNKTNQVISSCSKPQKKSLEEILRQILLKGTPILRHLVENNERNVKPITKRFSRHLENVDISKSVDKFILNQVKDQMEDDTSIAYDICDINKDDAEKMENISRVFDGSKRKRAKGFFLHGVGILDFMPIFEVHDGNRKTMPQVRKSIVLQLHKDLGKKGIFIFDRGNDSKQLFVDLSKEGIRFICRMRKNRLLVIKNTGEKVHLTDLTEGKYEVHLLNRNNNKIDTKRTYAVVIFQHLEEKDPMRLISNLPIEKYSAEGFVHKYLSRWGVEKSFRTIKTKFMLEKIRVLSQNRFINLLSLIRLAMAISRIIYEKISGAKGTLSLHLYFILKQYNSFLKRKGLTKNADSFITFISQHIPPFVKRKIPDPPNPSLFSDYVLQKMEPF